MVKSMPAMWEARVQSLGWEDPPEKEMATHSSKIGCYICAGTEGTEVRDSSFIKKQRRQWILARVILGSYLALGY